MFVIIESKLGEDVPDMQLKSNNYTIIRRDRKKGSGGILVYIKKSHEIISKIILSEFEIIVLTVKFKYKFVNFIIGYNPHYEFSNNFNSYLEELLKSTNLMHPTLILGDLNQDLLTSKGNNLRSIMENYGFKIPYFEATHIQGGKSSLIDVSLGNDEELFAASSVVGCPFSNHQFIIGSCNLEMNANDKHILRARVLNEINLESIRTKILLQMMTKVKLKCSP